MLSARAMHCAVLTRSYRTRPAEYIRQIQTPSGSTPKEDTRGRGKVNK